MNPQKPDNAIEITVPGEVIQIYSKTFWNLTKHEKLCQRNRCLSHAVNFGAKYNLYCLNCFRANNSLINKWTKIIEKNLRTWLLVLSEPCESLVSYYVWPRCLWGKHPRWHAGTSACASSSSSSAPPPDPSCVYVWKINRASVNSSSRKSHVSPIISLPI